MRENTPCFYECDQCSERFQMFILWDWVYAQALGVDPKMVWYTLAEYYVEIEPGKFKRATRSGQGRFRASNKLQGVLCEPCVEGRIGRKLCWWDYMHIAGNFPGVDLDFFLP